MVCLPGWDPGWRRVRVYAESRVSVHDQPSHRAVASQPLHHRRALRLPWRVGLVGARRDAGRRDSRPVGQPGDCVQRLARPQPAGSGGPGHVSAHREPPGTRRRSRRPIAVGVRLLDDLRDLRGQRGPVLRPCASARADEPDRQDAAAWRNTHTWTGRDRRRSRVLVHRRKSGAVASRSPHPAGLVHSLPAQCRAWGCGSRLGRRLRPAVPG